MNTHLKLALALLAAAVLLAAGSCDKDPLTLSPEELAERIRANTPTALPPVTTVGANTMGAWIHPQPGSPLWEEAGRVDSFLFVASGVDRPETALAESLDCGAFNNYRYLSNNYVSATGVYCPRPEIGDPRYMGMIFGYIEPDSVVVFFNYASDDASRGINFHREKSGKSLDYSITNDNKVAQVISGTFSGRLINRALPHDTLRITDGRFDVTYGVTP